jgi:AbiJ N-terminal domain 3
MAITSVTRRALVADLAARGYAWWGALEEQDFLCRLYPLERMPSKDIRYDNALADLVQHRVANYDWDDDWIFTDDRLGLGGGDDGTLRGSTHPS